MSLNDYKQEQMLLGEMTNTGKFHYKAGTSFKLKTKEMHMNHMNI
jgi:hypothetical protein